MKNFLAHTEEIRQEMLKSLSIDKIEDLFRQIPIKTENFNIGSPLSELQTQLKIKEIAKKNKTDYISFLGGGIYNKFIPAAVSYITQRFEFLTAYTPYQPEISQGTLQIIYEYQTMISRLTGMDIANASMYDGASACAEAVLMAYRISKGKKNCAWVSSLINPEYLEVLKTYLHAQNINIEISEEQPQDLSEYFCVLTQYPNFLGEIQKIEKTDTINIVCANLSALAIIEPPIEADIVVGDIQVLGNSMNFGGPHAGYMACKSKYMRQLPGRLVGRTADADGNQAFTLTIQTREQHIKREKATSNICSNQSLVALSTALYLSLLGEKGFKQSAVISANYAHALSKMLNGKGIRTLNKNFFNEFVVEVNDADAYLTNLKNKNILGGIKIDKHKVLIAVTEMNSENDILEYIEAI